MYHSVLSGKRDCISHNCQQCASRISLPICSYPKLVRNIGYPGDHYSDTCRAAAQQICGLRNSIEGCNAYKLFAWCVRLLNWLMSVSRKLRLDGRNAPFRQLPGPRYSFPSGNCTIANARDALYCNSKRCATGDARHHAAAEPELQLCARGWKSRWFTGRVSSVATISMSYILMVTYPAFVTHGRPVHKVSGVLGAVV
jgi:hypothetical protein